MGRATAHPQRLLEWTRGTRCSEKGCKNEEENFLRTYFARQSSLRCASGGETSTPMELVTIHQPQWATSRGLPRSAGHRAGAEAARRVIEAAPRLGLHTLTLFALSSANWKRPAAEVQAILRLLHEYLLTETKHCVEQGVRLSIIGRRDRVPAPLRQAIVAAEAATAHLTRLQSPGGGASWWLDGSGFADSHRRRAAPV